jgi:hypothetical protein
VTAIDTTCERLTRYHATAGQKEAFHKDAQESAPVWRELVLWLASFDSEFDKTCGAGK